jgi:hypothetical protein
LGPLTSSLTLETCICITLAVSRLEGRSTPPFVDCSVEGERHQQKQDARPYEEGSAIGFGESSMRGLHKITSKGKLLRTRRQPWSIASAHHPRRCTTEPMLRRHAATAIEPPSRLCRCAGLNAVSPLVPEATFPPAHDPPRLLMSWQARQQVNFPLSEGSFDRSDLISWRGVMDERSGDMSEIQVPTADSLNRPGSPVSILTSTPLHTNTRNSYVGKTKKKQKVRMCLLRGESGRAR